jgi:hypothetical protein
MKTRHIRSLSYVMRCAVPDRDKIDPATPLRLSVAAALAFPDGSMTASGLRREGARGKLVIERLLARTTLRSEISNG